MKKLIISLFASSVLLFNTGCSDWLDVNHDPNVLETLPEPKSLLPGAEVGIGNNLMGWHFGFAGGFWSEYWTQKHSASQFKSLCEYLEQDFDLSYRSLTAGTLMDLKRMKELSDTPEKQGYYYIAEALSIYTWQLMTDLWGDLPYSETMKAEEGITSPKFDKGQDIYTDLNKRIDELLKMDVSGAFVEKKYDFVYGGNMAQWMDFTRALKLKLMLRVSESGSYNNATVLDYVKNNQLLTASAKISGSIWSDGQEGKRHPLREFQEGGAGYFSTNVIACSNFIDYLKDNNDPRLSTLFNITDKDTGYRGAFFGDFESKEKTDGATADDKVSYAEPNIPANLDLILMSAWEVDFNIAEVYARANDIPNAQKYYEAGVKASLAQHGISDDAILKAGGYAEWKGGDVEAMIEQIGMQRWVANANYQHIEQFIDRNRTKYPALYPIDIKNDRKAAFGDPLVKGHLTISVTGRGKLTSNVPQSPTYPASVRTRNNNAPAQKANLGEPVWWNKKAERIVKSTTSSNE